MTCYLSCDHFSIAFPQSLSSNISSTNDATAMLIAPFESARQIGLYTLLYNILTVCRGPASLGYTNPGISRFHLYLLNQSSYSEMDTTIEFTASNRCEYILGGCSSYR